MICFVFAIGCGGHDSGSIDGVVGAACASNADCAHQCFQDNGDKFPGGFCSVPCVSDSECPADSLCMATAGGVCMFACPPFDCGRLPGYSCQDRDHVGGGKVNVCVGN